MISLLNDEPYQDLNLRGAWHLAYCMPFDKSPYTLSGKLWLVKANAVIYLKGWDDWAFDSLKSTGIRFNYILAAIPSMNLKPEIYSPAELLASRISIDLEISQPDVLRKKRMTWPLHQSKNYQSRKKDLDQVYEAFDDLALPYGPRVNFNNKNILIIDDITASGSTIAEILRALRVKWPMGNYYFFCLGRTTYEKTSNENIVCKYLKVK